MMQRNLINPTNPMDFFKGLCQWTSEDGKSFAPANNSVGKLPPGAYNIVPTPSGQINFSLIEPKIEELIRFPDANSDKVIDEIRKFWTKGEVFTRFGLPYKRGILLFGPPGSGKTCTLRFVMNDVIALGGVVINFTNIAFFKFGFSILRQIQPKTPTIVIMEDLDSLLQLNNESEVLNLLDGIGDIENTVFLATTNYPDRLSPRIRNRPSRFDKRFEIGFPNDACRRIYLEKLFAELTQDELAAIPEIGRWVADTADMSLAHLKELFSAVVILENSYEEAIEVLQAMNNEGFASPDPANGSMMYPGGTFTATPMQQLLQGLGTFMPLTEAIECNYSDDDDYEIES